jgi:hypothetical protein
VGIDCVEQSGQLRTALSGIQRLVTRNSKGRENQCCGDAGAVLTRRTVVSNRSFVGGQLLKNSSILWSHYLEQGPVGVPFYSGTASSKYIALSMGVG